MRIFVFYVIPCTIYKMAKHFLVLSGVLLLAVVSLVSAEGYEGGLTRYAPSSPQRYSKFLMAFYEVLKSEKTFDRLFDISFKPKDVGPQFYQNIRLFMMQLGVKNPRVLPAKVAAAAERAFQKKITPFKYFKSFSDSKEGTFRSLGILTAYNQDQLIHSFASSLKEALKFVGGSGPVAGIRALSLGSADFFKKLGIVEPYQVVRHIERFLADIIRA